MRSVFYKFICRYRARVRGLFGAVTKPTTIGQIMVDGKFQEKLFHCTSLLLAETYLHEFEMSICTCMLGSAVHFKYNGECNNYTYKYDNRSRLFM